MNEAQRIVELVLNQSIAHIRHTIESETSNGTHVITSEDQYWQGKNHSTIHWPTIQEFNDENVGLKKIIEYIENVGED